MEETNGEGAGGGGGDKEIGSSKTTESEIVSGTSPACQYFIKSPDEPKKVICTLCKDKIYRGIGRSVSTTSMMRHLETKHSICFGSTQKKSSAISTANSSGGQLTLQQSLVGGNKWSINSEKAVALHYAIGEMIALDFEPYSIVERTGFQRMIAKAAPGYNIPSRPYFSDNIVPDIFTRVKAKLAKKLEASKWISLTTDAWTSKHTNFSYLSLTAHWISESFEQEEYLLAAKYLEERHTGAFLAEELLHLLRKWRIEEKIHLLVRDNAANMKKAAEDAKLLSVPCFLHTLQLVIHDAMKTQKTVTDMISKCRSIATHFHHSTVASLKLANIQNRLLQPALKVIQDVSTRWNSTYYMLERMMQLKTVLGVFATEEDKSWLTYNDWNIMASIISVLKPFEEMTVLFSSKESTVSDVIPTVTMLRGLLDQDNPMHSGIKAYRSELAKSMKIRFKDLEDNESYCVATLLDPRYKDAFFKDSSTAVTTKEKIIAMLCKPNSETTPESFNEPEVRQEGPSTLLQSTHQSIWDQFSSIAAKRPRLELTSSESNFDQRKRLATAEIDPYLRNPLLELHSTSPSNKKVRNNPLAWWKSNKSIFPSLAEVAQKYLSSPPSTVISEQTFSEAGLVCEDKRSRLTPEHAESLIFLHHNLPKIDFDY